VFEDRHTHIPIEDYYRGMHPTTENLIDPYINDTEHKKPLWAGFGFPMLSVFNKKEEEPKIELPAELPAEQPVIDDVHDEVHHDDPEKEAKRRWKEDNGIEPEDVEQDVKDRIDEAIESEIGDYKI
jgi:hypothetical protein